MKGVLMTKMVQELNLTNLTPEIDLSEMRIMTAEINRPALQLTGYLEHFANERVQIIGYVEYTYLMQLSDEKRMMKYERFSERRSLRMRQPDRTGQYADCGYRPYT